jgi:HSP20 family protein
MRDIQNLLLSSEVGDLAGDIARLFEDLDQNVRGPATPTGTCTPTLDVIETDTAVEIVVDLPGVSAREIRVLIKGGVVVIAGEKQSLGPVRGAEASFHLVERGFGRFARAVRLSGAVDAGRSDATLENGELRVVIPKIEERRGREIHVPVRDANRQS